MLTNSRDYLVEWGDCDAAGIVYYPRYFELFDHSTILLMLAGSGLNKYDFLKKYDFIGCPMLETRARYRAPSRFGDHVTIQSRFTRIGGSSFEIHHQLSKDGQLRVEGFETRVWAIRDPADPERIKSCPIPDDLAARYRGILQDA